MLRGGVGRPCFELRFEISNVSVVRRIGQHFTKDRYKVIHRTDWSEGWGIGCTEAPACGSEQEGFFKHGKRNTAAVKISRQAPIFRTHAAKCSRGVAIEFQKLLYIVVEV